ncbi:MAG: class III poly(R)-hydroxyalkanoic acid synthase subunit PhaC [Desulfovermiculus sp.]|nr:class III poly(R)-hydroxyalkanoic acid synthase subunit PhaC [Desulfovermiculus sp.]
MTEVRMPLSQLIENTMHTIASTPDNIRECLNVLSSPLDTELAQTPYDVVYEEDRVKLKHYRPVTDIAYNTPLFIVYALINRETMLDLQPDRSVVRNLLQNGVDVYMLDWGYPTRKDRFVTIDDHVNGYMHNAVTAILKRHNLQSLNLMGICMGGTFSTIYAATHPDKVKNLLLTVTPINFDTDSGLLHTWWGNPRFDVDSLVDVQGNVSGDFLNQNFLLMNPGRLLIDKYYGFINNATNKTFVENFIRMESWIFDSPDVPGETFRQFIKDCYHNNVLIQNKMRVGGEVVDLKKVTMPVLNIYGQFDHLVPPAACEHTTQAVGSKDTEDVNLKTGHIGIYVSSKSQKEFVPKICNWLKERDHISKAKGTKKGGRAKAGTQKAAPSDGSKSTTGKAAQKKTPQGKSKTTSHSNSGTDVSE